MANDFIFWSDLSAPIVVDTQGAIKTAINLDAVKVSIDNILRTRRTERVMLPGFGSGLSGMVFEPTDEAMFNTFGDEIQTAINNWDDRVNISSIQFKIDSNRNFVQAQIFFKIRGYEEVFEHTTLI